MAIRNQIKTAILLFLLVRWSNCYSFWHNFGRRKKTRTILHNKKLASFFPIELLDCTFDTRFTVSAMFIRWRIFSLTVNVIGSWKLMLKVFQTASTFWELNCEYLGTNTRPYGCQRQIKTVTLCAHVFVLKELNKLFKQRKQDQLGKMERRDNVKRKPTCKPRFCHRLSIS